MAEPPPFQEADRCDVCNCSFSTFRRRHHCRCCGKTLCHEHSSYQMELPQFGIHSNVRVCYDCFNNPPRSGRDGTQESSDSIAAAADKISRLNVNEDVDVQPQSTTTLPILEVPECRCGMPLCICKAPTPEPTPLKMPSPVPSTVQSNPRPKKVISTQHATYSSSKNMSSSNNKHSVFFNLGQATNGSLDKPGTEYEVNGEGLREAIKNRDAVSVKRLLNQGVNANYCDKQGMSLLHLASLFNQTDIVFILMEHGARLDCKNAQGETPIDCAPAMLQYKMREKMEGGA
ncbi:vacuolar protein sorting-associated protein 27 [Cinnamomum micranthum f. kanehirae]|uniref:Vacuolar protein sorting-associated protein 27 n=1 Tax=Cinnamomum micranthum f. kanehirae TaxID=337451 RepID=A0A443PYF4_9MAGN|nr:vacuolar protein sorting-associated protein 27 [Cinnamomum micranthum f. kanehirae]